MTLELMSGNEAIAQGAWEAGASIGTAYPGTPSTETLETFARKPDVYAEWCTNEKVAVEVALGASAAGARVLCCMKHVGVNVAADPLFTAAYTGVGGGMLVLAADDPGMHSSQDEQDSRYYAQAAHIPCFEPADSAEALQFARDSYELSERFDVPFMLRSTVRISHTRTLAEPQSRQQVHPQDYCKDPSKWVMMPAYARPRRKVQLERIQKLSSWVNECPYNVIEERSSALGVICSGATYQYVQEALPDASILKLGVVWPLPADKLRRFADSVDQVFVIEEASTYLSDAVRACGITLNETSQPLPGAGELTPAAIRKAFGLDELPHADLDDKIPPRPPALCAGCPHRLVFKELSRLRAIVTGDIGCYTLGALPPLAAMDTCIDMGASVSMAHGFELARKEGDKTPVVAVIGDSTFAHSGLSSLISTVYNQGSGTVCILDNRTTAMTGRQGNPFNGVTLQGRESRELNLEGVLSALGIEDIQTVNPNDAMAVRSALKEAVNAQDRLSVIVFRSPCVLLDRRRKPAYHVNEKCTSCGVCATLGCPAISLKATDSCASIDPMVCIGCGQCASYCRFGAIVQEED